MRNRLGDSEVRIAAHRRLLRQAWACPDTLVIDELGLAHGACRIDIAVINGHIRGVEIKADADVLDRLPHQVAAYGAVVDRATLITAPRHVLRALEIVPDWWGVMLVERAANNGIRFRTLRAERANRSVDPLMLARLLWRPEAIDLLREFGLPERRLREPREVLYRELVEALSKRELARRVRDVLKAREAWRGRPKLS